MPIEPNAVEDLTNGSLPPLANVAVNPGQGLLAPGIYEYPSKADDAQLHQHINQIMSQINMAGIALGFRGNSFRYMTLIGKKWLACHKK